jgi:plastocyanin
MRMRKWRALALGAGSIALLSAAGASVKVGVPTVQAAQTWNVQVGADIGDVGGGAGGTLTGIGYYPSHMTVNVGDTVSWVFPSVEPHSVTFDNGHLPPLYVVAIVPGPNPGELDLSTGEFPVGLDQINGVFDPKVLISSGVPEEPPDQRQPFTLSFNTAGVFTYNCSIHGNAMVGTVTVAAANAALPETPDQAKARGQGELGGAVASTHGAFEAFPPVSAPSMLASGSAVVPVTAGAQPGFQTNVAALAFFPGNITVHRGDSLIFTVADPQEIHTVTFLSGTAPPPFVDVRPQPAGPPKLIVPANVAGPMGGNTYSGSGYLNSGILFPGKSFTVTFDAPPGSYDYVCLIHADAPQNMKGTITVAP